MYLLNAKLHLQNCNSGILGRKSARIQSVNPKLPNVRQVTFLFSKLKMKIFVQQNFIEEFLKVAKNNLSVGDNQHVETMAYLLGYESEGNLIATELIFPMQEGSAVMVVDQGKFTIIGVAFVMYLGFGHVEGSILWKTVCFGNLGYVNCNVHHVTNLDNSQGKGFPFY